MKKIAVIFTVIIFAVFNSSVAYASYVNVLLQELNEDEGLFFSCIAEFEEGEKLITVSDTGIGFSVRAYDDEDGTELCDELNFTAGGNNVYRLSVVRDGFIKLMAEINNKKVIYNMIEGRFMPELAGNEEIIEPIAEYSINKVNYFGHSRDNIYYLINRLQEKRLISYSFRDIKENLSKEETESIGRTVTAAADIMSFDSHSFNELRLMNYILNTSRNFEIVSPIKSYASVNKADNINLVNKEFADYVAENIFGFIPPKPYVNELVTKGYCVNEGYYYYKPMFNVYFSTEIKDIRKIYDLGGGIYYVVFRDIYTEGERSIPEYSFAVVKNEGEHYKILRLEMGKELIEEREVREYICENKEVGLCADKKEEENLLAKIKKMWYHICYKTN